MLRQRRRRRITRTRRKQIQTKRAGPVLFKKWSKSRIRRRWRPSQKKTTLRLWKNCSAAPRCKGAKEAKEHTVKSTINKWFEAVGEDDCQEDEPLQVISESFDRVCFHELRVPIHVNTVPKYKLVFTKDLKNATYNNKLGFLGDYDIRSKRIQVTLVEEDKTCLFKPENLSIDMETWPTDISKAAFSAIEDLKSKCLR